MNRLARLAATLLFLAPTGFAQEKVDPEIRRFANIAHWALQDSEPKENLRRVIRSFAAECELAEATTRKLEADVSNILREFVLERAKVWSLSKNVATVNRQSSSLKHSTMLIEQSQAFRSSLKKFLTEKELKKWDSFAARRHERESARLQILATNLRLKAAKRQAEQNFRLHVGYLGFRAGAFAGLRPLFGVGNDHAVRKQFIGYAKQAIVDGEKVTRIEFEQKLNRLRASCEVSGKQNKRLLLAIKGVVSRKYRQKRSELSDIIVEEDNEQLMKKLSDFAGSLSFAVAEADLKFWDKAVEKTLAVAKNTPTDSQEHTKDSIK